MNHAFHKILKKETSLCQSHDETERNSVNLAFQFRHRLGFSLYVIMRTNTDMYSTK
jgi:hypothetical protein